MPSWVEPVRVTGRFVRKLRRAPEVADKLAEKHAKAGVDLMRSLMPEKTGALKRETEAVKLPVGWGIRNPLPYFWPQNDGTVYFEGWHFVEYTLESVRKGLRADLRNFGSLLKGLG